MALSHTLLSHLQALEPRGLLSVACSLVLALRKLLGGTVGSVQARADMEQQIRIACVGCLPWTEHLEKESWTDRETGIGSFWQKRFTGTTGNVSWWLHYWLWPSCLRPGPRVLVHPSAEGLAVFRFFLEVLGFCSKSKFLSLRLCQNATFFTVWCICI